MAYFDWTPDYDLGIAELDRQRRRLLEIVNRLYEAVEQNCPKFVVQGVMCDLVSYVEIHLAYKERMMQRMNFPGRESHRARHKVLTKELKSFETALAGGGATVSTELKNQVRDWLTDRLIRADQEPAHYDQDLPRGGILALSC